MTEQLIYRIYKIVFVDFDEIYIGSTRLTLKKRLGCHRRQAIGGKWENKKRVQCNKPLSQAMRKYDFSIHLIEEITVSQTKYARIEEQKEIENHKNNNFKLLNVPRAYSENHDKTRCQIKKRKNRRDYYNRKRLDREWMEKQRERNRVRMRLKRSKIKHKKLLILVHKELKLRFSHPDCPF